MGTPIDIPVLTTEEHNRLVKAANRVKKCVTRETEPQFLIVAFKHGGIMEFSESPQMVRVEEH